ncbi:hypothetical protein B0H12DRAFT_1152208 [Mycena haematopus]|nr:hypothetical protein B0H12DRAFT_1152208 [Mycena haematopus]
MLGLLWLLVDCFGSGLCWTKQEIIPIWTALNSSLLELCRFLFKQNESLILSGDGLLRVVDEVVRNVLISARFFRKPHDLCLARLGEEE